MNKFSIRNSRATQIQIDNVLFDIPYRLSALIDYKEVLAIHCAPDFTIDKEYIEEYKTSGRYSLFIYSKKTKEIVWKSPNVEAIEKRIPEEMDPNNFITVGHYDRYLKKHKGQELIVFWAGEFKYIANVNTGEVYDKMESR